MPVDGLPCEGPEDALITVVEYVGYECPFTRRLEPTVRRLLDEHRDSVRFCVRQRVIRADQPHGLQAAHVALETFAQRGDAAFFRLHRAMLDTTLTDSVIVELATQQGVETSALRDALESDRHAATLERDRELLYNLDKSGTPQLFISGRVISGAKPYEDILPTWTSAIEEAQMLVDAGVAKPDLYTTVQRDALRAVEGRQARPGEPERVRIRFIAVATSAHPLSREPRTLNEARAVAERLATEIRDGADFGALAVEWSAASNRVRGGEFGWLARGTLTEETEDVALSLAVGEVGVECGELACSVIQRLE